MVHNINQILQITFFEKKKKKIENSYVQQISKISLSPEP